MNRRLLNGNARISRIEHRAFYALICLGLVIWAIVVVHGFRFPEPQGAVYSIFDQWWLISWIYCFPAFLLLIAIHWKISIVRLILTLLPLAWLVYFYDRWFLDTRWRMNLATELTPLFPFGPTDFILLGGNGADVITLLIVNILLVWQIFMIVRLWREPESISQLS